MCFPLDRFCCFRLSSGLFHPPQFLFPERLHTLKLVLKSQTGDSMTQLLDHFVRGNKELPEPLHTRGTVQGSGCEQRCSWRTRNVGLPIAQRRRGALLAVHRDAEHWVVMERQQIETATGDLFCCCSAGKIHSFTAVGDTLLCSACWKRNCLCLIKCFNSPE